jgi:hypothetical protein
VVGCDAVRCRSWRVFALEGVAFVRCRVTALEAAAHR